MLNRCAISHTRARKSLVYSGQCRGPSNTGVHTLQKGCVPAPPMSLLDEVKRRTDIVQVVADYVDLDTSSRTPKALCPFHSERTPSFVVYPDSGNWHCFGSCADGGDAVSFVMKKENLSFGEALRLLAERAGISAKEASLSGSAPDRSLSTLYEANEAAASYFRALLKAPSGESARSYLESRGISMETAERRGMGMAPTGMESLAGHLRSKGIDARAARDAGLMTRTQDGGWRDMFRGRLTIEIRDARGRLVGFGARSLDGSEPKYLNTPKSDAFDKSRILYGLHWAADSIRSAGEAVVVEGYMDAITAHENGFTNVVASMGTAITSEQLDALSRLVASKDRAGAVILCLDSDAAGENATFQKLEELMETPQAAAGRFQKSSLEIKVAHPAGGKDPDEAIKTDPEGWRQSLAEASPLIEYFIGAYSARYDLTTGDGKARVVERVAPLVFRVANQYEQDRYWTLLAEKVAVAPERLQAMIQRPAPRRRTSPRRASESRISPDQMSAALESGSQSSIEEHLLAVLLQHPELREYGIAVPPEHFHDSGNREIFTGWQSLATLAELSSVLDEHLVNKVEQLQARPLPPSDHLHKVEDVTQCVSRLRERHFRHLKVLEESAFAELEQQSSGEEREELLKRTLDSNSSLRQVFIGRA